MSEVKWIKITTDMFNDEKIKIIESMPDKDAILIIWIKLLTLAGKVNANGYIFLTENIPYTDEMLATVFNRPLNTIRLALETFKRFHMIDYDENMLHITNWEKHQNTDGLEKIREQNRLRKQRQREREKLEKQKLLEEGVQDDKSHVTVTGRHAVDIDIELDKDIEKEYIEKDKTQIETDNKSKKDKEQKKIKFAEFVSMTNDEYQKLLVAYGEEATKRMIEILDNYKGSTGRKYKSDYRTILNWVVQRYEEEKNKQGGNVNGKYSGDIKQNTRKYTFDKSKFLYKGETES